MLSCRHVAYALNCFTWGNNVIILLVMWRTLALHSFHFIDNHKYTSWHSWKRNFQLVMRNLSRRSLCTIYVSLYVKYAEITVGIHAVPHFIRTKGVSLISCCIFSNIFIKRTSLTPDLVQRRVQKKVPISWFESTLLQGFEMLDREEAFVV